MLGDSRQASSATTSLFYLTSGALIDVWAVVYYFYLRNHQGTDIAYLFVYGFIFTGIVLFAIGLAVGRIGHSARSAEVAPMPTQQVVAPGQQSLASVPPAVVTQAAVPASPTVLSPPPAPVPTA